MPFLASTMEQKFFAGLAWSLIAMDLPRSDSRLVIPADFDPRSLMQPPCTPAAIRTSNPCSNGLSQRNAMPIPASALPVAIASSSCSVEPPKLTKSTSRLCFANNPRSFATGPATVQIEDAFHASVSARRGPDSCSPSMAVRHRGNSPSAPCNEPARNDVSAQAAPRVANGDAAANAPLKASTERRESRCRDWLRLGFLLVSPVSMTDPPRIRGPSEHVGAKVLGRAFASVKVEIALETSQCP